MKQIGSFKFRDGSTLFVYYEPEAETGNYAVYMEHTYHDYDTGHDEKDLRFMRRYERLEEFMRIIQQWIKHYDGETK